MVCGLGSGGCHRELLELNGWCLAGDARALGGDGGCSSSQEVVRPADGMQCAQADIVMVARRDNDSIQLQSLESVVFGAGSHRVRV